MRIRTIHKATIFALFLFAFVFGLLIFAVIQAGPIVLGTECRTAGRNGDQLFLGAVDCSNIEPAGGY